MEYRLSIAKPKCSVSHANKGRWGAARMGKSAVPPRRVGDGDDGALGTLFLRALAESNITISPEPAFGRRALEPVAHQASGGAFTEAARTSLTPKEWSAKGNTVRHAGHTKLREHALQVYESRRNEFAKQSMLSVAEIIFKEVQAFAKSVSVTQLTPTGGPKTVYGWLLKAYPRKRASGSLKD